MSQYRDTRRAEDGADEDHPLLPEENLNKARGERERERERIYSGRRVVGRRDQDRVARRRPAALLYLHPDVELHLARLLVTSNRTVIPSRHKSLVLHRFPIGIHLEQVHHIFIRLGARKSLMSNTRKRAHHSNQSCRRRGIHNCRRHNIQHVLRISFRFELFALSEESAYSSTVYVTAQETDSQVHHQRKGLTFHDKPIPFLFMGLRAPMVIHIVKQLWVSIKIIIKSRYYAQFANGFEDEPVGFFENLLSEDHPRVNDGDPKLDDQMKDSSPYPLATSLEDDAVGLETADLIFHPFRSTIEQQDPYLGPEIGQD